MGTCREDLDILWIGMLGWLVVRTVPYPYMMDLKALEI
jgi:hypothetical protein